MAKSKMVTDPYGFLGFAIGSGDDFWCFDYHVHNDKTVTLHAVINSETGAFIMDAEPPVRVPFVEALDVARGMVDAALDWCGENHVRPTHRGWNQDPAYFFRCVRAAIDPSYKIRARRRKNWVADLYF